MEFLISLIDFLFGGLAELTGIKVFVILRLIFWSILCWFIILICIAGGFTALKSWGFPLNILFAIMSWIFALIFIILWIIICFIIIRIHRNPK